MQTEAKGYQAHELPTLLFGRSVSGPAPGLKFIDENGSGPAVRLRERQ